MNYEQAIEVLGVPHGAGHDEVKKAYRARARRFHPDLAGGESTSDMASVNEAREVALRGPPASPLWGFGAAPDVEADWTDLASAFVDAFFGRRSRGRYDWARKTPPPRGQRTSRRKAARRRGERTHVKWTTYFVELSSLRVRDSSGTWEDISALDVSDLRMRTSSRGDLQVEVSFAESKPSFSEAEISYVWQGSTHRVRGRVKGRSRLQDGSVTFATLICEPLD